ncbi:RdgB/HAM1 family non-canonical purine NTP pyrophosphatase [Alicyclobacillus mengziensis]|uniref:dITP/XTP pyrophosphatase n=1 Tax=Alicyclobacillus mengziensis TaxID=2931921 RepID=A0A9X7VWS7_9BACL|nr:RdgB/HAM1 family non-canonical purine NTP pyrophosphatase [Alicyclobacillus mengziensis]QSO45942.1 RdgB/HAM1 family non-canonical purine NTP pyrophosphatase [Alicyclobacillus mengziensis]
MQTIVIASKNTHKINEFRQLLSPWDIEVKGLPQGVPDSPENGSTFEANAMEKAVFYATYVDDWVLADDSGLCVDALEGRPGVHSARYSGVHGDDAANREKVLRELAGYPGEQRTGSFACAIAVYHKRLAYGLVVRADVPGYITDSERGTGGFGYDPLFYVPPVRKTFAELSPEDKNQWSHRAKAVLMLMERWKGGEQDAPLCGE